MSVDIQSVNFSTFRDVGKLGRRCVITVSMWLKGEAHYRLV